MNTEIKHILELLFEIYTDDSEGTLDIGCDNLEEDPTIHSNSLWLDEDFVH